MILLILQYSNAKFMRELLHFCVGWPLSIQSNPCMLSFFSRSIVWKKDKYSCNLQAYIRSFCLRPCLQGFVNRDLTPLKGEVACHLQPAGDMTENDRGKNE